VDVTLFPEYGPDKAHRAAYKQRNRDAQGALFDIADDDDQVEVDPNQLTLEGAK
jgi:hypothetical protein